MTARIVMKRLSLAAVLMFVFVGLSVSNASAHVTVKPGEVQTATYQTFTVSVPNEKDIPTTEVRILVPSGVQNVTPTQKSGWKTEVKKDGDTVTEIVWKDGEVGEGLRDEFTFSAKTPDTAGSIEWKAYQTYSDGTVVAWDKSGSSDGHGDENSGPSSLTAVAALKADAAATTDEVANANSRAERAIYIAIAAVIIALISVFFATRKNRA